jgi:hypothetical protein
MSLVLRDCTAAQEAIFAQAGVIVDLLVGIDVSKAQPAPVHYGVI